MFPFFTGLADELVDWCQAIRIAWSIADCVDKAGSAVWCSCENLVVQERMWRSWPNWLVHLPTPTTLVGHVRQPTMN